MPDAGWQRVTDFDRTGRVVEEYAYCPECWPQQTITAGQKPDGSTLVHEIKDVYLKRWVMCHQCGRTPGDLERAQMEHAR